MGIFNEHSINQPQSKQGFLKGLAHQALVLILQKMVIMI